MRRGNFLCGNRTERDRIEKLLRYKAPAGIEITSFVDHCQCLLDWLESREVRSWEQFDLVLCEYLDDFGEEMSQCLGLNDKSRQFTHEKELAYLMDVERALDYLRVYIEQLSLMPIPRGIRIEEGTRNTVLLLRL